MSISDLSVIATVGAIICFFVLGAVNIKQFYSTSESGAGHALCVSNVFVGLGLTFKLIPTLTPTSPLFWWMGCGFQTMSYLYLVYALIVLSMPCHVPLLRSLTCPFCGTAEVEEPPNCRQSVLRTLFTAMVVSLTTYSVFSIGVHLLLQTPTAPVWACWAFPSPPVRLPMDVDLIYLITQTTMCIFLFHLITTTYVHFRSLVFLAMALVLKILSYLIYLLVGFMEVEAEHELFGHMFHNVYNVIYGSYVAVYVVSMAMSTLSLRHNLFLRQRYLYLMTIGADLLKEEEEQTRLALEMET